MKRKTLRKGILSGACLLATASQGSAATAGFGVNLIENGQAETPPPVNSRTPNVLITGWEDVGVTYGNTTVLTGNTSATNLRYTITSGIPYSPDGLGYSQNGAQTYSGPTLSTFYGTVTSGQQITDSGVVTGTLLGNAYFYAGGGGNNTLSQRIDLGSMSVGDLASIDSGSASFLMEGWFGGYSGTGGPQGDTATLSVKFFDVSSVQLGSTFTIGGGVGSDMTFADLAGAVPGGSRSIQFDMNFVNVPPGANDGGADNLAFVINVPEPGSAVLLGLGGLALWQYRRRRRT